jgi:hypothetical protein
MFMIMFFLVLVIDEDNDEIIIKNDADLRFYGEQTKAGKVIVRVDKPVEAAAAVTKQKDEEMEFIPTSTASPANGKFYLLQRPWIHPSKDHILILEAYLFI